METLFDSDSLLHFVDFIRNQSAGAEPELTVFEILNSTKQVEWLVKNVRGSFGHIWSVPFQLVLTKWGFCFSFNLMPLSDLTRRENNLKENLKILIITTSFQSSSSRSRIDQN
jgi:hypothetical protein